MDFITNTLKVNLVYETKTEDVSEDFYKDKNFFSFSDYSQDSMKLHSNFFDPVNKKVIGKVKHEFKGQIISEFVGLNSKMYSLIPVEGKEIKKQKESIKILLKT